MSDVKWIKIVTDIFDDEKILLIESLPDSDSIIVIWFKLLCLAGKNNNSGVFVLNEKIAYTDEMFATIFRRPINTIRLALKTFEEFGMVQIINGAVTIPNWGKHQNLDQIENKKEYMKGYMREYREKQKLLTPGNSKDDFYLWIEIIEKFDHECAYCGKSDSNLEKEHIIPFTKGGTLCADNIIPACRSCNASKGNADMREWYSSQAFFAQDRYQKIIDHIENPECKPLRKYLRKPAVSSLEKSRVDKKEKRKDKTPEACGDFAAPRPSDSGIELFVSCYNETCINLPAAKMLTEKRKTAIRSFLKQLTYEQFQEACQKANESPFCTGENDRGWKADFDFLIRPDKATSILEGKYDATGAVRKPIGPGAPTKADPERAKRDMERLSRLLSNTEKQE